MVAADVERFTERVRRGEVFESDRDRRPFTDLRPVKSPVDAEIAEVLLSAPSEPEARAALSGLHDRAHADRAQRRRRMHDHAIGLSHERGKSVAALAQGRRRAAEALVKLPPGFGRPQYILLTEPYLIWPTGITLQSSGIAQGDSFAKFEIIVDPDSSSYGAVRFLYYWTNPYDDEQALINIDVLCTWNGLNDVTVDGGLFVSDRNISSVAAWLDVNPLWDPNLIVGGDYWSIFGEYLDDNTLGYSPPQEVATQVHSGSDLRAQNLLVPPLRTVVFSARVSVDCQVDGAGLGVFDYASGSFQVGSPYALVTVLARYPQIGPRA
ncbi:MAG: hypothetical protein U1E53_29170 [Dongiaceae bacterium]